MSAHRERHVELHRVLDELVADYLLHTGRRLSNTTILELVEWSHEQTKCPTEPTGGRTPLDETEDAERFVKGATKT